MVKRQLGEAAPAIQNKWVALEEWDGIAASDTVVVKGERGNFRFVNAHEHNGVVTAINVYGGMTGHEAFRTFTPARVGKPVVKRRRGA